MVYNHAPTALLAAQLADVPILLTGTGFEIPPQDTPLPSFQPWKAIPLATHIGVEQQLLALLNPILNRHRKPSLSSLSELFQGHRPLLTTFPGLDPFGPRHNAHYIGPVYALPEVPEIEWQQPKRVHILAYLRPGILGVEFLLEALQNMDAETICAVPGLPREWPRRFPSLRFYPHAVNLSQLLPATQLMISYGAGTIGTSLLAGVPVLLIPQMTEQYLTGLALERLGAGLMLHQDRSVARCKSILHQLLSQPGFRSGAHNFAQGHTRFSVQDAAEKLWQALHLCLNRSPASFPAEAATTLTSIRA
jgi:UDP:flavonoid glycosyltransferase YjiC (YdhE family)